MRRRLVRLTVVVLAATLMLFTTAFWLLLRGSLRHDSDALAASRARAAAALVALDSGRLVIEETPGDEAIEPGMWLYDARRALVARPPGDRGLDAAAAALAAAGPGRRTVGQAELCALAVQDGTHRLGTVVVALSLAPYTRSERLAVGAAGILDVVVLAGSAALARRLVGSALRPVAAMTAQARDWGAHDPDRRFGLGPPRDEITGLASTLDGLLTRIGASLRHETLVTAQIAHELKAPLARMRASAEAAIRYDRQAEPLREALALVVRDVDALTGVVETLMRAHCGTNPTGRVDLAALAGRVAHAAAPVQPLVRVTLVGGAGPACLALCDPDLAERVLAPVVDNALRHARSAVTVELGVTGPQAGGGRDAVRLAVRDDGPGFAADEVAAVFEPGYRGAGATGEGAGLGLTLARRLARLAGGDVVAVPADGGHVVVTLPASPDLGPDESHRCGADGWAVAGSAAR
jgi:signal transduction histidine kinase